MVYYGLASFQTTHWRPLRNLQIKECLFFVLPYGKEREVTGITAAFENFSYIYIKLVSASTVTIARIRQINEEAVSDNTKKAMKLGLAVFTGKALSETWIYRWHQWRIFVYKYKLSLVLLYWNDMLMKKLKTKSNGVLNTMVSKTEEFTISLEEMSPQKLHKWLQMLNS